MVGNDTDKHNRLLRSFVESTPGIISAIDSALSNKEANSIIEQSHKLKSSARAVGATELANTCHALEKAGMDIEWDNISSLCPQLNSQFSTLNSYVNQKYIHH